MLYQYFKSFRKSILVITLINGSLTYANIFTDSNIKHIAIIVDGNRRWAADNFVTKKEAHEFALLTLAPHIAEKSFQNGLNTLTYYYFSTENWYRDEREVNDLMVMMPQALKNLIPIARALRVRITHMGRNDRLPFMNLINEIEEETKEYSEHFLNLAIDYGGRNEIERAAKKYKLNQEDHEFRSFLDTPHSSDPDILIRTGGAQRLSGFMLWQAAYTELFFIPKYFPEFVFEDIVQIIEEFAGRKRRFGK